MYSRRWVSRVRTLRRRRPRAYIPLALRPPQPGMNRAGHAVLAPEVEGRASSTENERQSIEAVPEDD